MRKSTTLILKTTTWTRESHGLFDYESTHIIKKNLKAVSNAKLIRIKNDIHLINDNVNEKSPNENSRVIACLKLDNGVFSIIKPENDKGIHENAAAPENLWMIVRSLTDTNINAAPNGYMLSNDDIIKLGRIKFRVKKIKATMPFKNPQNNQQELNSDTQLSTNTTENLEKTDPLRCLLVQFDEHKISDFTCRICLSNESNSDDYQNFLISPCSCSGSVKYVHINCLKMWIKSKGNIKETSTCITYSWKSLQCELCHKSFPDTFLINGQQINIIDIPIPKPESNYLILENMSREKQSHRIYHVLTPSYNNNVIKIGRGHDCNIRLNDISVSRCHAIIRLDKGKFYIEDNNSKFGTLVLLKNGYIVNSDFNPSIQIGRTILSCSIKTKTILYGLNQSNNLNNIKRNIEQLDDYDNLECKIIRKDNNNKTKPLVNLFDKLQLDNTNSNNLPNNSDKEGNKASSFVDIDPISLLNTEKYTLKDNKQVQNHSLFDSLDYKSFFSFSRNYKSDQNLINQIMIPTNVPIKKSADDMQVNHNKHIHYICPQNDESELDNNAFLDAKKKHSI